MQFFKNINDKLIKWLDEKIAEADKEEQAHKPYSVDTQNLRINMSDWANVYKNMNVGPDELFRREFNKETGLYKTPKKENKCINES